MPKRWVWQIAATQVMGVLNVTPDSFFDGGRFTRTEAAIEQALRMVGDGADLIDVGGESSRPGAEPISVECEIERVVSVIEGISRRVPVPISIDTTKVAVAEAALDAGARIVNDIAGFRASGMAELVARTGAGAILMHMRGEPQTMQQGDLSSVDVVGEVVDWLKKRAEDVIAAGVLSTSICLDPGIGFGKTVLQNLALTAQVAPLRALGYPVLIGVSRKSFIGEITGKPVDERLFGTAAACTCAVLSGADIVRVHDVSQMQDVVRMADALRRAA